MGHHYVPQYYLKGFSKDDCRGIWVSDKKDRRTFCTQIKRIAKETNFYSTDIEQYLANSIEGPANDVIKRIRDRTLISKENKLILSAYMTCMIKRVPRSREIVREFGPKIAQDIRNEIEIISNTTPTEQTVKRINYIREHKSEFLETIEKYSKEPPKGVWLDNIPAERSSDVVEVLSLMKWQFFTFDEYPAFLTSDNPVFYFTTFGIGNPQSEVSFPISSNVALWASRRLDLKEGYVRVSPKEVKELNRRTVSFATRFVFHSIHAEWVLPLLLKGRLRLNRIQ